MDIVLLRLKRSRDRSKSQGSFKSVPPAMTTFIHDSPAFVGCLYQWLNIVCGVKRPRKVVISVKSLEMGRYGVGCPSSRRFTLTTWN
jgi:hypothetical protein